MKKFLLLFSAVMVVGLSCAAAHAADRWYWEEGNDGMSWETAYVIDSAEELMILRNRERYEIPGAYYRIAADLEISDDTEAVGYSEFTGHIDGQGHTVRVNIRRREAALFFDMNTDGIAIRNLNVEGQISGQRSAGGILLYLRSGIVENCSFSGNIGTFGMGISASDLGGIAASNSGGIVRNCTFGGRITASAEVNGGASLGGIVSRVDDGAIEGCTVFDGSELTSYTPYAAIGGIVGGDYSEGRATISGNTLPSEYNQVGYSHSGSNAVHEEPQSSSLPSGFIQPASLDAQVLDNVARTLSVDFSEINQLTDANISAPQDPTQAMSDYIKSDNHEITGKLSTISADVGGWYVFKVSLSDELYALLRDKNVDSFKFYGLSDSETTRANAAFISGLLSTWEILTLSGEKMTKFGVREFLMVGLLNAGTPFSIYIAKMLLAIFGGGGCNAGIGITALCVLVFALARLTK